MHCSSLQKKYLALFTEISGKSANVKSSHLLKAYATLSALKNESQTDGDIYPGVLEKYKGYRHALLPLIIPSVSSKLFELSLIFTELSLVEFLKYVVPDIVCDPDLLMTYRASLGREIEFDDIQFIHHIISVKYSSYQENIKTQTGAELNAIATEVDALDRIYSVYLQQEKENHLPKHIFFRFYKAINTYSLNPHELDFHSVGYPDKRIQDFLDIIFDNLQLTRNQAISLVTDFFAHRLQADIINRKLDIHNFAKHKDSEERANLIQKALRLAAKISPLELICAISIRKKSGNVSNHKHTELFLLPNDVTLENSIIYLKFFSQIHPKTNDRILLMFPSPHFTRKVLMDDTLFGARITCVFRNNHIAEALEHQAAVNTYAPHIGEHISFVSFSDWSTGKGLAWEQYKYILTFNSSLSPLELQNLYSHLLDRCSEDSHLFALESSRNIETTELKFLCDPRIFLAHIDLIPQGINNSSCPRRKALLQLFLNSSQKNEHFSEYVTVSSYTLNTTLKTQALSPLHASPVLLDNFSKVSIERTLRNLYAHELLNRRASGRKRNAPFPQEITPDITVWCSKTYPSNNRSRPRLEAYVCEPPNPARVNSAYTERGKVIPSTKKHVTHIDECDIINWLENIYPYSTVSTRSARPDKANLASAPQSTSIRDEIIRHYTCYLSEQNIALKTFWYLHPNLSELYSEEEFDILSEMMCSNIGQLRVRDLTAKECEYLLITEYVNLSQTALWHRYEIIAVMIDRATEAGYCATNPLRLALCQKNASNRFFAQVRRSLAKKHFTADELRRAYCYLRTKLEQGHHQYLGVLIRLLTGLESSIICALRWEDFHYSPEYHLHYFIITRQIDSNNIVKGFRNLEDYICFPLASQLSSILTKYMSPTTISQQSSCIVNDVLPNNCIYKAITPKVLNTLVKEMISAVGIDPRIVTLPDQDGNFRETDLNKYHGDFLRENFRHWAGQFCNLNADEMDYLLRRKATTTLGHYYCDFLNEASQLIIQVKLNRLESITNPKTTAFKKHYLVLDATHICNIAANPSARTSASLELTTSGNSNIALHFESPYGYSYEVTPIISEEDKA